MLLGRPIKNSLENPKPSSTFYCRPLNFQFIKESKEVILDCSQSLKDEKQLLNNTILHNNILVRHEIYLTMIDGKICTCLAGEKSSMVCYICGAKPTEMNRPEIILEKDPKEENYQFGLSSLHSWIRSFECLLHISYNLSFQKWSARSAQDKESKENKKKLVQQRFRFKEELGLNVDIVKQGVGTSNDGNTARRFFANPEKSSEITGIDINLIKKFHTILQVLASGERVDPQKYDQYCRETAQLYISLYNWYFMPASVHKILFHGEEIIKHFLFPVGQLSEEASEARNKHFRFYRESRARKCNRKSTNEDVLNNLLLSSDPFISNLRSTPKSNVELTDEAKSLLL